MKKYNDSLVHFINKFLLLMLAILLSVNMGICQQGSKKRSLTPTAAASTPLEFFESGDLEYQLPPLDTLVNIAIRNSPVIKISHANMQSSEADVTLSRRSWQDYISVFGNYSSGNQRFVISGTTEDQQNNLVDGYRYGVNVLVPLSEITTRRPKIQKQRAELDAARESIKLSELELERQVTDEYLQLIAAQRTLKILSDNRESTVIQQQLAEKQFKEGTISLEEYSKVHQIYVSSEVNYEMARKNFRLLFLQFETLLGVPLIKLIQQK